MRNKSRAFRKAENENNHVTRRTFSNDSSNICCEIGRDHYVFNIRHTIVAKPISVTSKRIDVSRSSQITLIVIGRSPFPGRRACTRRSRERVGPLSSCVRYIRVHVRILIPPRQLLACPPACLLACLHSSRRLVSLLHSNPHSRAPPRGRAQVT